VDYVADAVSSLTFDQHTEGMTFHLTAPYKYIPTVKELIDFVNKWAEDNMDLNLPKPVYLSLPQLLIPKLSVFNVFLGKSGINLIKTIEELAPYLNENREFSRNNLEKFMDHYPLRWEKFLPELLKYAVYNGFFHRSKRTVHEQVLFRLKSRSRKVNFYDIEDGNFVEISANDIHRDILAALNSLKVRGIGPGDRVAMVGFNTTRYLILDIAVGLLGAVSVPLYYTSPVAEINEILNDCGARLVFVGTPQLLEKSVQLKKTIPIISFCSESVEVSSDVTSWNDFINHGIEVTEEYVREIPGSEFDYLENIDAPVDFNDIATIRYTSGTTGKPSGVTFTHGNLRWMAEFIASMPPWSDRTHKISYLSFLPMNHVVEGILGTYAPYYAPAPLELYFLKEFQELQNTLPRVKPTIFFSVPRFYEKVWSKIQQSNVGHVYLHSKEGWLKNILSIILRRSMLKQTGLDACAQLIVGSAPVSEDLLKSYHELGVEIHNAYGLTEAPLVTRNRLGFNRIGTVGEPLPLTDVKINDDGEVLVRGPQVTPGYFKNVLRNNLLFQDNWLLTGDYGYITSEGSLVITGRKKELIVNSYGKSISPLKIEAIIKDINGVSEVMVVGDEKPYCISLLWVEDNDNVNFKEISIAIKKMNSKLSNPEKIKRWAILKNDLTIENGDLTANLKLKRNNILNRHISLINFIYSECKEKMYGDISQLKIMSIDGEGRKYEY
jgi:long-chain acyl-CoA synthetase